LYKWANSQRFLGTLSQKSGGTEQLSFYGINFPLYVVKKIISLWFFYDIWWKNSTRQYFWNSCRTFPFSCELKNNCLKIYLERIVVLCNEKLNQVSKKGTRNFASKTSSQDSSFQWSKNLEKACSLSFNILLCFRFYIRSLRWASNN
jgi:hypothetical protein